MIEFPIAHIDDEVSVRALAERLRAIHGPAYDFGLLPWDRTTDLDAQHGRVTYVFVVRANEAMIRLYPEDLVRGGLAGDAYRQEADGLFLVTKHHLEPLWPGDVFTLGPDEEATLRLYGQGIGFQIVTEESGYAPPRLALLRNLADKPGGCAAYPGAFRREALPPDQTGTSDQDARGVNRINEHTLDMRNDRNPPPIRHYHGPVAAGAGGSVPHSEIAIVLPRSAYGLPEVDLVDRGHLLIYRDPKNDPTDIERIAVTPGSIVVTPATPDVVMGHCFENVFAMLVAIPGFVAPYHMLD